MHKKIKVLLISAVAAGLCIWGISYHTSQEVIKRSPIADYVDARDRDFVLHLFDENWYWLLTHGRDEYSPEFMLDHRSRTQDPKDFGKLTLKVFLVEDQPVGFVGYLMETFFKGKVLFLAVDSPQRGNRFGEQLLRYACKALFEKGARVVQLLTRTDNKSAQALYKRVGFKVVWKNEGFVYFEVKPDTFKE
ncbi:GNAT family N-acetyltransferase [Candidatus Babeliales bacterium]|nr:GNAT family N-acetyltransferase [Candidatus Babeliales bacterium]